MLTATQFAKWLTAAQLAFVQKRILNFFVSLPGSLDTKLGSSPVSSLGVVSNGVVGLESDPLGQGSVLSRGLGQLGLGLEGLETLGLVLCEKRKNKITS